VLVATFGLFRDPIGVLLLPLRFDESPLFGHSQRPDRCNLAQ